MKSNLLWIILLSGCSSANEFNLQELFSDYQGQSAPGAAVMVIRDGKTVVTETYGMADLERGIPVKPSTNFRLASVSKQFTAMCIMILEERGKLSYETRLREIFPQFPEYADKVTIRQLLQHTSGLAAYESLLPDTLTRQVSDADVLALIASADSLYFQPGSEYRYNNSGYAILAMIVEKISGQSFADFLGENIFKPLGMKNSVAFQEGVSTVANRAFGYTIREDSVSFSDQSRTSAVLGDGGVYSSLDDLFKWDQALYTEKLVSKKTMQTAFEGGVGDYGFGWGLSLIHI